MPRTTPWGSVGIAIAPRPASTTFQVVVSASGWVVKALTPGPSRCVAKSVSPSAPHARLHGLRGVTTLPYDREAGVGHLDDFVVLRARHEDVGSSWLTTTPIGSEQTATLPWTARGTSIA